MSLNICKLCKRALRGLSTCAIENCIQGFNPLVLTKEKTIGMVNQQEEPLLTKH